MSRLIEESIVDYYLERFEEIQYAPTSMRNITSQICEMIYTITLIWEDDGLESDDIDLFKVNRIHNDYVMLTLPEISPIKAMHNEMKSLSMK
ncbi:hypothetical protein GMD78_20545 [Ornithinibacillus sp. L9]|uniref:DUF6933 domain-containing protein n=1 Tax=Ornithinibacillus caprae TaxID=2678566 RepID=A0A6N8FRA6_9BACI|nr:hypothetical protein [Ornithinibacillus caprae]MUK90749.1 hypothetical protein [Ornithinibacillus caprae]